MPAGRVKGEASPGSSRPLTRPDGDAACGEGSGRAEEMMATMRIRCTSVPTRLKEPIMTHSPIRKIYQGITERHQMFRMFDRHAQRPNRWDGNDTALYNGEWFELGEREYDYMFEILPPLWMRGDMFAMREFLTGSITSVFFTLRIDGQTRYFHGYCDLADKSSAQQMRTTIIERETRPVRAMTREERLEHIWSSTADDYRGYADFQFPVSKRGRRKIQMFGAGTVNVKLLEDLTDAEISAKLPVHLRYLPDAVVA